jgi:hypothetical protein
MDCQTARELLELLDPDREDRAAHAREHVARCPECAALLASRSRFDERVARAMREVELPVGLRERLSEVLNASLDPEALAASFDSAARTAAPSAAAPATTSAGASARPTPPNRRRLRSRLAAGAVVLLVLMAVGGLAWRALPAPRAAWADLRTQLAECIEESTGHVDLTAFESFDGSFDAVGALAEIGGAGLSPVGIDLDGRPGHDAAAALVSLGRGGAATALLVVVPAARLQASDEWSPSPAWGYEPAPHLGWRRGEFIYVCMTAPRNLRELKQFADAPVA